MVVITSLLYSRPCVALALGPDGPAKLDIARVDRLQLIAAPCGLQSAAQAAIGALAAGAKVTVKVITRAAHGRPAIKSSAAPMTPDAEPSRVSGERPRDRLDRAAVLQQQAEQESPRPAR